MDLMGISQNLVTNTSVDRPTVDRSSQVSKTSSDGFQKKLAQAEKSFENKTSSQPSTSDKSNVEQSGATTYSRKDAPPSSLKDDQSSNPQTKSSDRVEQNALPTDRSQFGKPQASIEKMPQMVEKHDDQANLVDQDIQSNIVDQKQVVSPKEESVDSLTRRAAIQTFMQKMKNQLGVESTEIVDAFQKLSLQELAAPPEKNVDKIISFLQLDPKGQQIAKSYFNDMVAQSSANSIAEYLKGTDREISLQVLSEQQKRQNTLEDSLAQLNSQFFTQPKNEANSEDQTTAVASSSTDVQNSQPWTAMGMAATAGAGAIATASNSTSASGSQSSIPRQSTANSVKDFFASQQKWQAPQSSPQGQTSPDLMSMTSQKPDQGVDVSQLGDQKFDAQEMSPQQLKSLISQTKGLAGKNAYGLNSATPSVNIESSQVMTSKMNTADSQASLSELKESLASLFQDSSSANSSSDQQGGMDSSSDQDLMALSDSDSVDAQELGFEVDSMQVQGSQQNTSKANFAKPGQFMVGAQPTDAEQSANVKEIVNHANLLVKNGGGEMKIALNPEGLGQVNLKVAVDDGQVSVEMVTESSDAKKLLEKGLGDLKATLASHKLSVDNVKVDFSGEIAKQFDHAHDEAQRQSAQNFMEQFRQENGAWRRNFFDIPGARMTEHPNENGPESEMLAVQSTKKQQGNRRLNLVA